MPPVSNPPDIDPAALARADAALAALADRYLTWVEADLARLEGCLAPMLTSPDGWTEGLVQLFGIAHDMKGQGATFDYPLVTELGNRLCRLLETVPRQPTAREMERIAVLVDALGRVVRQRLSGDGGEAGRRLLQALS